MQNTNILMLADEFEIPKVQKNQKIEYLDALKGFAMFCVLWGHSFYLKNNYVFFHNPIFEFKVVFSKVRYSYNP